MTYNVLSGTLSLYTTTTTVSRLKCVLWLNACMLQQLQEAISDTSDAEKKESSLGLNLLLQFLFQELKDTQKVRRYVLTG